LVAIFLDENLILRRRPSKSTISNETTAAAELDCAIKFQFKLDYDEEYWHASQIPY